MFLQLPQHRNVLDMMIVEILKCVIQDLALMHVLLKIVQTMQYVPLQCMILLVHAALDLQETAMLDAPCVSIQTPCFALFILSINYKNINIFAFCVLEYQFIYCIVRCNSTHSRSR